MVAFNKIFSSVLLAILYASLGDAISRKHSTHHARELGSGLKVMAFHPSSNYKNGIPFVNAVTNVAFENNKVVAFGSSFVKTENIAESTPTVDVNSVIPKVEEALQGKKNDVSPSIEYLALEDGKVALVHVFQVQNEDTNTWYEAYVDAHNGELLLVTDFVSHASYKVLPVWKQTLPEGLEMITDPALLASSPNGWHNTANDTSGNNVHTYRELSPATTKHSDSGLVFNYTYDEALDPTVANNLDAARTNAFYVINSYHDTLYQYGFTEEAFNFQRDNFGKGGPTFTDSALFNTPPDGLPGRCTVFLFTKTDPRRDGDMENDVLLHEITHGTTQRMTGGGTSRCLQTLEALGMGEGWSDAYADWFWHSNSPEIKDFVIAPYITNNPLGLRSRPYSTSTSVNEYTYASIGKLDEEHAIGEVWANMLHNLYADLVAAHGWSATARTSSEGTEGNVLWMNILTNGLTLQPCNPTLADARDAIVQADVNKYGGAHRCLIWRTFASRGLGVGAADFVDSTVVPDDC